MRLDLKLSKFKVHHVGIFTHDIVQSSKYYSKLGFNSQTDIVVDPIRNIRLQILRNLNHYIELIEATDNRNFDSLRSANYSIGYHLCFEVEDLDSVVENLTSGAGGYKVIDSAKPAILFGNRRVIFLYSKYSGIIELLEE